MKKLIALMFILLLPMMTFASPFGLKMGMSLKEVERECTTKPVLVKDDFYIVKPKKVHPLFDSYLVFIDKFKGLYQIRAISSRITTNRYGAELQDTFIDVIRRISKTYGEPKIVDELDSASIYKDDADWLDALRNGARTLAAVWGVDKSLKNNIASITLECNADKILLGGGAFLILYYYFENANKIADDQDSVF
jgi:hypothetical protein